MIRLSKMGGKWYSVEIQGQDGLEQDIEHIVMLVEEGTPVLIVQDLDDVIDIIGCAVEEIIRADG